MKSKYCIYLVLCCCVLQLSTIARAQKSLSAKEAKAQAAIALDQQRAAQTPKAAIAWQTKELNYGAFKMKFDYKIFGEKPTNGRSLYISMHGGGEARPEINDGQWRNQMVLYQPSEGVYLVPRAPTNSWNMWHQGHIDTLFAELIKDAVIMEGVNLNKVYIMGYSAGGDGVYQLAPRMADFWAAAAMMAGHPGDAAITNLRNVPFTLFMGGDDDAYDRNELAAKWAKRMNRLAFADPGAYIHDTHIYPGMPHWMDHKDTIAVPWMAEFVRKALPNKVIWVQDEILKERFYWLGVPHGMAKVGNVVQATVNNNLISIERNDNEVLELYLNDSLLNLDEKVTIVYNDKQIFNGKIPRNIKVIQSTAARMDENLLFSAMISIKNGKVEHTGN